MFFFNFGDQLKQRGDLCKALLTRFFCESWIHCLVLIPFPAGGLHQIFARGRHPVVQQFEPDFRMFFFVVGRLEKQVADLFKAVRLRLRAVKCILIARLRFARERRHQIRFRFGTLENFLHNHRLLYRLDGIIFPIFLLVHSRFPAFLKKGPRFFEKSTAKNCLPFLKKR